MKLLELLVQELPKRGGWPSEATKLHQDYDGEVWMHLVDDDMRLIFTLDRSATNARQPAKSLTKENIVTRLEYEAALNKSSWNGTGVPPVGCECEFSFSGEPYRKCEILFLSKYTLVIKDCSLNGDDEESYCPEDVKFRPIQSEADKKRDKFIHTIIDFDKSVFGSPETHASSLYDAIAAGKIPGIKLE